MLVIECPKRYVDSAPLGSLFYEYYAGYSYSFASALIESLPLDTDAQVLDPWNGAGTTLLAAAQQGHRGIGFDLNPAMVIVAKARLLRQQTIPSVIPIREKILETFRRLQLFKIEENDPLSEWFCPEASKQIRRLEYATRTTLLDATGSLVLPLNPDKFSDIAAFFYTAIFRVVRAKLLALQGSNPTWFKRPRNNEGLIKVSSNTLIKTFQETIELMCFDVMQMGEKVGEEVISPIVRWGNSENLPVQRDSVDLVLTSPPYCTRIDYAVATVGELAVIGVGTTSGFDQLRSQLMGTTKVPREKPELERKWGASCLHFLGELEAHYSRASSTYYLKNHLQYFQSLSRSISCIAHVLKPQGVCVMVAQDSYYKDIHNDLPTIISEMSEFEGLVPFQREDFQLQTTLSHINKQSRTYIQQKSAVESVLCFYKP